MSEDQETVEEEAVEEAPVAEIPEQKNNCEIIPENMKPLLDCCKEFKEGKLSEGAFFAKAVTATGEFMQSVQKESAEQPESAEE